MDAKFNLTFHQLLSLSTRKNSNMKKMFGTLLLSVFCTAALFAQPNIKPEKVPNGWHLLDKATSGYNGISLDKAYEFLKSKKTSSTPVVVAVIDSGIDTLQEDLKPILWVNKKEIPGNGIDDDKNGFIDDIHGWNFLGGKDGRNVKEDSYEAARVYYSLKDIWATKDSNTLSGKDKETYLTYLRAKKKVVGDVDLTEIGALKQLIPRFLAADSSFQKALGKVEYKASDLKDVNPKSMDEFITKQILVSTAKENNSDDITNVQLISELQAEMRKADDANTPPPNYRKDIVQDNELDINDRYYGNNDIMAGTPFHGTHCSGIIAAIRNNGKGMDGVADNVRIMMLRAVPDGDEHDKDIANAIRYAVDNGAKVISMSFGKDFSPQKQWVDDAFKYAEQKGVLLVKAAGNDSKNVDTEPSYPNPNFENGKGRVSNLINVGASGDPKNGGLVAKFSNYGKKEVDIFAPGVGIYSTIPGVSSYGNANGTSMACPVVAGVAALILEHFPKLTPQQVKLAIEQSAQVPTEMVKKPGTQEDVNMSELAKTGGIINAYEAVKNASIINDNINKKNNPKTVIKKTSKG